MLEKLYNIAPHRLQNVMITLFNLKSYRTRYGAAYSKYLDQFQSRNDWSLEQLKEDQQKRYAAFIQYAMEQSSFFSNAFQGIKDVDKLTQISQLPILNKEQLRSQIDTVYTIAPQQGVISKTGGTTGKSLEVVFTKDNLQERFAMLDNFRGKFGYKLGTKTAWFSGKNLLSKQDVKKRRFWKTDHYYKVRYYSTFHIKQDYLDAYVTNLKLFAPKFIIGFPSSIYEIAKHGLAMNTSLPKGTVKAIFPTAETITEEHRRVIESFFNAPMYDQYASSEGAPFIFECEQKKLHLELQSGVFEVLDDQNRPTSKGKLVVTSFTTYGTPLIRYDIGDAIQLEDGVCSCGNNNPLVKQIMGRVDDYLYSPENGKINLGNVSNTLKDTKGIVKFQAVQKALDTIEVRYLVDEKNFDEKSRRIFEKNWTDRFGSQMTLTLIQVESIEVEASGKFRFIKNDLKHLIS